MFTAEHCNSDKPSKRTLQVQTIIQSLLTTDLCRNVGQTSTADVETWGQNWKGREVKEFRTWLKFHGWGVAGSPLILVSGALFLFTMLTGGSFTIFTSIHYV